MITVSLSCRLLYTWETEEEAVKEVQELLAPYLPKNMEIQILPPPVSKLCNTSDSELMQEMLARQLIEVKA